MFLPRYLDSGSPWLTSVNLLIGMLLMVTVHCLVAAAQGKEKNYLLLGLFYIGALINATGNIYVRFFVTTIEPYIGSWLMLGSFVLFIESYLALPKRRSRILTGRVVLAISGLLLLVSVGHNLVYGRGDTQIIFFMDVVTAVLLLGLLGFLLVHAVRGNRKALYLFFLELTIVVGGIAALGVVKSRVVDLGIFPIEFFQSNLVFIVGMTLNGILFSSLLGFDLTRLKVKTALAEERNRELKDLDRTKNDLMMNLSHEFRTPITIIDGVTKQLMRGKWGDSISANRRNIEVIERNNLRLQKHVDGILRLTTMEKQQQTLHPVRIDLQDSLTTFVGEFASLAELKHISLDLVLPEAVCVIADADLFRTALVNLLGNALKYTTEGGGVSVSVSRVRGHVRVAVSDTGVGIPEEEQQRIFHRFHRLTVPGDVRTGGAGIGLSLVKRIMERHNGTVELESDPGSGSTFTLVFPVLEEQDETATTLPQSVLEDESVVTALDRDSLIDGHRADILAGVPDEGDPLQSTEEASTSRTKPVVLVVEDDSELHNYLKTELGTHFALLSARHGGEALEQLERRTPDLVISDVMMPEMDGYQLLAAMLEDERFRVVPILFLTARDSDEERIAAYEEGVVDYITKPFSVDVLVSRARNIIEKNSALKEGYQQYVKRSVIDFIDGLSFDGESKGEHDSCFADHCRVSQLTDRETEVALLVRQGLSDKEIASHLGLAAKTVGNYNSSIFKKCGFAGRLDLVAWGRSTEPKSPSE
jgi:signal transduction histidine kinase/DNA-binding NarL/FixJ family response regulator